MERYTIVVTEPIHEAGIRLLEESGAEVVQLPPGSDEEDLVEVVAGADALITRGNIKVTRGMMEASPRLRVVGVHGIGCDHIDLEAAGEMGKVVVNTPSAMTETVAEMAVSLTLALVKKIVSADKAVRSGEWTRKYGDLMGSDLMGKTVGIVGLGRIGTEVARRLKPFNVELLYWSRTRKEDLEAEIGLDNVGLEELLARSDIITLHVPSTPETHGLLSEREFGLMKEGAYIVNTARGGIVDHDALVEALRSGKVAGAALDVFDEEPLDPGDPLASMDNVILTPHISASSREAMERMAVQVAEDILRGLKGAAPRSPVVA